MPTDPEKTDPCATPNQCIPDLRNRYFTGKFMNALDFTNEQDYLVKRRWLQNRLFQGWGIACGLGVEHHWLRACQGRWVVIKPGIALDCRGREIIVRNEILYELPLPPKGTAPYPDPVPPPFLLCVRYNETTEQPVPALEDGGGCRTAMQDNYIREGCALEVLSLNDPLFSADCWSLPNDPAKEPAERKRRGHHRGCLEPECPCGRLVPLALINTDECEAGEFAIDLSGRRLLDVEAEPLTPIVWFNWRHGGEHLAEHFHPEHEGHDHHRRYRLRIRFGRPLHNCPIEGTGIEPQTYLVQYRDDRLLKFVPHPDEGGIYYDEKRREAIYEISHRFIHDLREEGREFITIHVTLRCDFILDFEGKAVDGDFVGAVTPTGNGTQGGRFESWFRLRLLKRKSDTYEQHEQEETA
jgi:hypothetical protein